jgi:hypothetical protein
MTKNNNKITNNNLMNSGGVNEGFESFRVWDDSSGRFFGWRSINWKNYSIKMIKITRPLRFLLFSFTKVKTKKQQINPYLICKNFMSDYVG